MKNFENVGILIEINPECVDIFHVDIFKVEIFKKVDDLKNFQMAKILEFWKILKKTRDEYFSARILLVTFLWHLKQRNHLGMLTHN